MALACVAPAAVLCAAPLPEPALRLSPAIESPGMGVGLPLGERALLRVEWQAAQTREEEARIVDEIVTRVRRMNDTVAQIRTLIETWPDRQEPSRPAPAAHGFLPQLPDLVWKFVALAAAGLLLIWLPLRRRRKAAVRPAPRAAAAPAPPPATTSAPVEAELPLTIVEPEAPELQQPAKADAVAAAPVREPQPPAALEPLSFESISDFGIRLPEAAAPAESGALPKAGDTDQTVELAEIMLSMGLAHGAAQTLVEQIRQNPKQALFHWLKLLDVYRRSEMREDFERATADMRQYFNVQAQDWGAASIDRSLEDYTRLAERLQALWPTPACADFLKELIEDNRGGTRNGFPQSVAEEILLLQKILAAEAGTPGLA